jgi:hypothetical protein
MSCEKTDVLVVPGTLLVQLGDGRVAEVPLEDYTKSALPAYLEPAPPVEALKALAIAVRSGAVVSRRHARDGFDLCTAAHCLAWQPAGRSPDSDRAVDGTAGQVLVVAGTPVRIVAAPLFEQCDGRTRSSEEAWGSPFAHCLSVPCPCGGSELLGDGVGLCRRGAVTLANQGAAAAEILQHYYAGTEVATATAIPRAQLCQSLVVGRVVDSAGRPRPGVGLALSGPAGTFHRTVSGDGRFWLSGLPVGAWELTVKGTSVRRADLHTDGRNTLELQVVVPSLPPLAAQTVPMAHPKRLMGTVGYNGVPVTITDSTGSQVTVESGSAPEFDPGGFVVPLPPPGPCSLQVLDQRFDLEIGEMGVWVRFSVRPATAPG